MLSIKLRRLGVVTLLLVMLGGGSVWAASTAGAVGSGPSVQVNGFSMCDNVQYGYPGTQMVQYLFTSSGVAPGYALTATVSGFYPPASFVGSSSGSIAPNQGGNMTQVEIPNSYNKASLTLSFVWSGAGLPTVTQNVTTTVPLSESCSATSSNATSSPVVGIASTPDGKGYWLARANGQVILFGDATSYGEIVGQLNQPIVGISSTSDGKGYWLDASDGGIFAFGDAAFYGSMGGHPLNKPMVGMTSTPDGKGYWTVASDGGIFSYGDAAFYGSTGAMVLNQPVVGMAVASQGHGYYLVARDGGLFAFGAAPFQGSMGGQILNRPVVGMATAPSGGYWEVASDGGIFSFGGAPFYGSTGGIDLTQSMLAMTNTPSGNGYWFVARDGEVYSFGDAGYHAMGS